MKNLFSLSLLALGFLCSTSAFAQPLASGYYRVQNHKTTRYAYVRDFTGSIDKSYGSADVGSLELWKNREFISDPSSVIYIDYITHNASGYVYDLKSQGTGVHDIIDYYVYVSSIDESYQVHAEAAGVSKYLADDIGNPRKDQGQMGFDGTGEYRKWDCLSIDASTDSYFGVLPTLQAEGKYYYPFYAAFPFNFYSNGMKAYIVTKVDKEAGIAVISEVNGDVPGSTPLIIETSSPDASSNRLNLLKTASNNLPANALGGVFFNNHNRPRTAKQIEDGVPEAYTLYSSSNMRVLGVNNQGKLVFKVGSFDDGCLPANQSYLQVDADAPAELVVMTEEEYNNHNNVLVGSITLNASNKTLEEGETFQLTATVSPNNATDTSVSWSSSNPSVATVSATGLVTAVAAGTATITAKANDESGVSATCNITVEKPVVLVSSVVLDQTEATLVAGETLQLSATVSPEDATDASLTWSSSNPAVATVSRTGLVTAVAAGTATITAKANDASGKSASCSIVVENPVVLVSSVELSASEATILLGDSFQLSAVVTPENATDATLTWSSSDETIATVDESGLVTAVASGTAIITATTNDGSDVSASCAISVTSVIIDIEEDKIIVEKGGIINLKTILPEGMEDEDLTWSSSDESIVIVNEDGTLTAVSSGTVTITVTASDGSSYSVTITVEVTDGINNVMVDANSAVNVYTLTGVKVRNAGESLAGLPSGLYIIDGKKVNIY